MSDDAGDNMSDDAGDNMNGNAGDNMSDDAGHLMDGDAPPPRTKRSGRSILLELALWTLLSLAVAVAMVVLSEKYLPTNF